MSHLTGEIVVDAHQHFWALRRFSYPWITPDLAVLRRDYLPEDLLPEITAAGVDRTVLVQACSSVQEAHWLLDLAAEQPFIAGVVGWADLASPEIEHTLDDLVARPGFVGVRYPLYDDVDDPGDPWSPRPDVLVGLRALAARGLTYDLLLEPQHLRHVPALAEAVPELRMVVDHLAKPRIAAREIDQWSNDLAAVAAYPNVYCKLSGMVTEAEPGAWTPTDLRPYVTTARHLFGPERVMFGSDWPVCRLAATYSQTLDALLAACSPLTPGDQARLLGRNARAFYRLP